MSNLSGASFARAEPIAWWSRTAPEMLAALQSTAQGLSADEARLRLRTFGPNSLRDHQRATALGLFLNQFKNPLVLILIFAATVSAIVREWVDATIVIVIVFGSALLSFAQEYSASAAIEKLRTRITLKTQVIRDGQIQSIPSEAVVPGDVVRLSAGSLIPADGIVLEAKDFFVNQAVLTGETFPVEKKPGVALAEASLSARTHCIFLGTTVRSGSAQALIVKTGATTEFGKIAEHLTLRPPETDFERGIRHFGYLLTQIMIALVLMVFAVNVIFEKPPIDSLLFAIALAVGLAPELLPAIISINLAKGAQHMAAHGVIVRRLNAIEDFGSMDVLCTDKTGTLTAGVVKLDNPLTLHGQPSADVFRLAYLNAHFQTGLSNPLDEAILGYRMLDLADIVKLDEVPYDFTRKRLSVVVQERDCPPLFITKGALDNVLAVCAYAQDGATPVPLDAQVLTEIQERFAAWSTQGYRVLGVASKPIVAQSHYTRDDEHALCFAGFLLFFDPPKPDAQQAIHTLAQLGVQLKIITGDNRAVATHVAQQVGMSIEGVLSGADLHHLHDDALLHVSARTTLFVDVDPSQKERIILALQKSGRVVGYMGDGINDAPALRAADVGISVDTAVDVAKEAADFVLLEHDLDVLREGIEEGRKTFANTLKYVFTTTSANFGNMFSMAGASLFLPFLPLLAKQILLNNFLSDFPAMTIASDDVDRDWVETPHRWNMKFIRNFMLLFGLVSSLFDFLTFGALLFVVRATETEFHTGWFIESLLTELAVALVVRTRKPFFQSKPGRWLWVSTVIVAALTILLPYSPLSDWFGFVPLPWPIMLMLISITVCYVLATELVKRFFYARYAALKA